MEKLYVIMYKRHFQADKTGCLLTRDFVFDKRIFFKTQKRKALNRLTFIKEILCHRLKAKRLLVYGYHSPSLPNQQRVLPLQSKMRSAWFYTTLQMDFGWNRDLCIKSPRLYLF